MLWERQKFKRQIVLDSVRFKVTANKKNIVSGRSVG